MPFGYLEFSRAIRGKPCPRARAPLAAASRPMPGSGSDSLPGPVLFKPDLMGMGYNGSYPLRHPDPKRISATVQTKPLQPFGWVWTDLSLPERYK